MLLDFEKYAAKGNEFVNVLQTNLGAADRPHAARILRSTFRALRNHISPEESLQLLAQLPMAIKAVYIEGWRLSDRKRLNTIDDLLIEIIQEEGNNAWRDFGGREEILEGVRAVIATMRIYVSEQEIQQALNTLPRNIRDTLLSTASLS